MSLDLANLISLSFLSLADNAFKNITNTLHALRNSKNITTLLMGANFRGETLPDDGTISLSQTVFRVFRFSVYVLAYCLGAFLFGYQN